MQNFDFNEALKAIQSGKPFTGSDGVLAPLIKQLSEAALSAEIDSYLEQNPSHNRRNGYSKKTVKSIVGSFELETPGDRNGEFEPERGNSEASLRYFLAQAQTTGCRCSLICTIVVYKIF